jgi:chloramphenicol 3-O-phosphotransferase
MTPRLVVITGPAAAGKSTLARALQARFADRDDLWLVLELDLFARSIPRDWIAWRRRQGRLADRGFTYSQAGKGEPVSLSLGADARLVLAAFHRTVAPSPA